VHFIALTHCRQALYHRRTALLFTSGGDSDIVIYITIRLRLDPNSGEPLGLQMKRQIRFAVATGKLAPGERMPSARELAETVKVNFHTVRKAYGELEQEGLLVFERGRGTFVSIATRRLSRADLLGHVHRHISRILEGLAGLDLAPKEIRALVIAELDAALRDGKRSKKS